MDGGVLTALDGVWYHSSENIRRGRCLHITKDGVTAYYHAAPTGAIVKPGDTPVLPVMAEMTAGGDGERKQDCELAAAKRRLKSHGEEYARLKPALLGEDLYSREPFCRQVLEAGCHFIFTCKDKTHQWLTETVQNPEREARTKRERNGQHHLVYTCRWVNDVPIRYAEQEELALRVNWLEMSIWNEEKGKRTFYSRWITDKEITEENAKHLADCGRAWRKIENEHTGVLKNHGYNLEHDFGHGQAHAGGSFCVLNLPAFLYHTVLYLGDDVYRRSRERSGRRDTFYNALRYTFSRFLHENWSAFIVFIWGDEPDG